MAKLAVLVDIWQNNRPRKVGQPNRASTAIPKKTSTEGRAKRNANIDVKPVEVPQTVIVEAQSGEEGLETVCNGCKRAQSDVRLQQACVYCDKFWLCKSCGANSKSLEEHLKTHADVWDKRSSRKRGH